MKKFMTIEKERLVIKLRDGTELTWRLGVWLDKAGHAWELDSKTGTITASNPCQHKGQSTFAINEWEVWNEARD